MLKAENLTKTYNEKTALDGISFEVQSGDIFCLLGANGAGKTTTINLFLNFIDPTDGVATIGGKDVVKEPLETKKLLAYIPENLMLYPNLTGLENLEYFSGLAGKKYQKDSYVGFLDQSGLQKDAHHQRVSGYSKGMRQKVGVAIALAKEAKVLLLDEPTSGLDPKASNDFANLLKQLSAQGVAILMATHDLFRAKETGTHIGIMKAGKLVEQMTTAQINHSDLENLYLKHMN
ncbi:MAG: ABC transporter ATP-binding protein [Cyclobacteriaceae bacterium]